MTRLFFALAIDCPWPKPLPEARLLQEGERHVTLAFLGEKDPEEVLDRLKACDTQQLKVAPAGSFNRCIFLPPKNPRCISWHVHWLSALDAFNSLQQTLQSHFLPKETRPFLAHTTIGRRPFSISAWKKAFYPLPVCAKALCLYKSLGNLRYEPIYTQPLLLPFEEQEHTADIAFLIRGETLKDLYSNAAIALSFTFTPFVSFIDEEVDPKSLDDVIASLNAMIAHADARLGCPIKAVSYYGQITTRSDTLQNTFKEWEMVVDV